MDKRVTLFLILCLLFSLSAEAKDKFAAKGAKNPIKVAGQEFCNTNYRVWFAPNSWSYRMEGCLYGVQLAASVGTQNWEYDDFQMACDLFYKGQRAEACLISVLLLRFPHASFTLNLSEPSEDNENLQVAEAR